MSTFGAGNTMAAPAASLAYGGFWIRFVAYLIDAILLNIVIWAVAAATGATSALNIDPSNPTLPPGYWTFMGVSFLIPAIYTIGFWVSSGATPGKMAFGLRVVRSDTGGPISTGQAIGRFLGYLVSSAVFCLGFIWVGFDARKQGWHDKLASTVVVRRRASETAAFRA